MDPLTLGGTVIGILAAVAGIVAAVVQVREYLEKRRRKPDGPDLEVRPLTPPPAQVPHNLPPRREFVGREKEKARVHEALRSRYPLTSIDGIGGIGKTVLALEVAHECLRASKNGDSADEMATFEGFIWTTAKDRDLTLNALLDAIARTLDYPGIAQQPVEEKQIAVQKLLQGKPYLLIVDNFETITDEGVRDFLLELPEPSKALITTREQKLRRAWAISLKGLTEPEALTLIRNEGRRLGMAALERAEDRLLLHLYQATGGAPLAIKWGVGQIGQRGQSLDIVLAELHEARGDVFDKIFSRSWNLLSEDARQVLMVMPIFATSASRAGIKAASGVHHFALDKALGQLVEMSLVDATDELDLTGRRYSIHSLTNAFAWDKLRQEPEIRKAGEQRVAQFVHGFTREYGGEWKHAGFTRLEPELRNIVKAVQLCWEHKLVKLGIEIVHSIRYFMINRGYWNDLMDLSRQAIRQATKVKDELSAANLRVWPCGWIHRHRGDLDAAERQVIQALSAFEQHGEQWGAANAKRDLGRIAQARGQFERAEQLLAEALAFFQSTGDERFIYFTTGNLAELALEQGDLDTAEKLCDGVLVSALRFGDPQRIAHLLQVLGGVSKRQGDLQQAKDHWEGVLFHMKRVSRLDEIADALVELAQIEIETRQKETARQRLLDALDTYTRLDMQFKVRKVKSRLAELSKPMDRTERKGRTANEE
jgi:tetratricopeptide (TPR) repeat protein